MLDIVPQPSSLPAAVCAQNTVEGQRSVGDDNIGEELDFNLSWSWRLRFVLQVSLLCNVVRESARPFDF